eukprot:351032-Chlamydomonas_euryale.AAC.6
MAEGACPRNKRTHGHAARLPEAPKPWITTQYGNWMRQDGRHLVGCGRFDALARLVGHNYAGLRNAFGSLLLVGTGAALVPVCCCCSATHTACSCASQSTRMRRFRCACSHALRSAAARLTRTERRRSKKATCRRSWTRSHMPSPPISSPLRPRRRQHNTAATRRCGKLRASRGFAVAPERDINSCLQSYSRPERDDAPECGAADSLHLSSLHTAAVSGCGGGLTHHQQTTDEPSGAARRYLRAAIAFWSR